MPLPKPRDWPEVMHFSKVWDTRFSPKRLGAMCFYEVVDKRPPRAGEYFVSGAIPEAYFAPNDLSTVFTIVKPTFLAKHQTVTIWDKGEPATSVRPAPKAKV